MYLDTIRAVVESVEIPVAVKVGHAFTAFAHFAKRVEGTGARAWCSSTASTSRTLTWKPSPWCLP